VRGEVWRLDASEVLQTLDDYEGYNFLRCTTTATLANGRRVRTWMYRYHGPKDPRLTANAVKKTIVIPEGDWRRHRWR
jgi:gamma-glutamylcyclotransferase (GGCT)/AIG2-like uncharacterized protein YtfP